MTASKLGETVGVSESTVVRLQPSSAMTATLSFKSNAGDDSQQAHICSAN